MVIIGKGNIVLNWTILVTKGPYEVCEEINTSI